MVLGAGLLRFYGVFWIVLLHRSAVSGRANSSNLSSVVCEQFLYESGSKFNVKGETLPFIEGAGAVWLSF